MGSSFSDDSDSDDCGSFASSSFRKPHFDRRGRAQSDSSTDCARSSSSVMFRPDRGGGGGHSGSRGSSGGNGPNGGDDGHLACRHYLRELRGQLVAERQRRLEAEEATSVLVAEICSSLLTELEKVKKQARDRENMGACVQRLNMEMQQLSQRLPRPLLSYSDFASDDEDLAEDLIARHHHPQQQQQQQNQSTDQHQLHQPTVLQCLSSATTLTLTSHLSEGTPSTLGRGSILMMDASSVCLAATPAPSPSVVAAHAAEVVVQPQHPQWMGHTAPVAVNTVSDRTADHETAAAASLAASETMSLTPTVRSLYAAAEKAMAVAAAAAAEVADSDFESLGSPTPSQGLSPSQECEGKEAALYPLSSPPPLSVTPPTPSPTPASSAASSPSYARAASAASMYYPSAPTPVSASIVTPTVPATEPMMPTTPSERASSLRTSSPSSAEASLMSAQLNVVMEANASLESLTPKVSTQIAMQPLEVDDGHFSDEFELLD